MIRTLNLATSMAATLARFGAGLRVGALGPRPEKRLELFEFEACPYCRKVREALTVLDLEALILPCPKGGPRFRQEVKARGGKYQFPYLVDPNIGTEMYESDAIVAHLFRAYGSGPPPVLLRAGPFTDVTAALASGWRPGMGGRYRAATHPEELLELWSFESSPYCRIVREALCALEIPYVLHNVGRGSPSREAFVARSGKMQVPYLADPNTGVAMFESADIASYLTATYSG